MVDILGTNSVGRERPDNLQVDELTASASGRSTWQRASRLAICRLVFITNEGISKKQLEYFIYQKGDE